MTPNATTALMAGAAANTMTAPNATKTDATRPLLQHRTDHC